MGVRQAIRRAEALLPGTPVDEGTDPRWQAIIAVGDYIPSQPQVVWRFVQKWGRHPQDDLRMAIATCLLEHLLENHFAALFPLVKKLAMADPLFADTFLSCWKVGQAEIVRNARSWDALRSTLEKRR